MNATQQLRDEHEGILTMLNIVEKICTRMDFGEEVDYGHLHQIIEFLRVFADRCHHGKEEDLLFPAMEQADIAREGGPIGVMLTEHGCGRDHIRAMDEALKGLDGGDESRRKEFTDAARQYTELLRNHIAKENQVLFVMADRSLTEEAQKQLVEEFERVEKVKIGEGKHEAFHRLMDDLAKIYL